MVALLGAMMLPAAAQDSLYVVKGNTVVEALAVGEGDYATFQRPADVPQQQTVELEGVATGKNFIKYKVSTKTADQYYAHGFFQSTVVDYMLQQYYGIKIEDADEMTVQAALRLLVQHYGYTDRGTLTYTITNGENDGQGTDFFVPAGQDFYVVACNLTDVDEQAGTSKMGDECSVVKLTTLAADKSAETIGIEYTGLNDDEEATYAITPSSGIVTLYTMLAKKKEFDQNTSIYGFDKVFFGGAESWTATDWNKWGDQQAWELDGENDYVMTVLGIDANGDWVTATDEQHITTASDNCPKVNILSKEVANGTVTVKYEITPSNVTAAHVRLMKENDVSNAKNNGETLDQIAISGDAEEVTSTINYYGEATFSKADLARGWYDLLISATDENGTNVTEVCFHSHLSNAEWEIRTTTYPTASAAKAQKVAGRKIQLSGNQTTKSMAPLAVAQDEEQGDSVFIVKNGVIAGSYKLGTDVDYLTFRKPAVPDTPQEGNSALYGDTTDELQSAFVMKQSGLLYVLVSTEPGQTSYEDIVAAGNYLLVAIPESKVGEELKLSDYVDSDDYLQAYYMNVDGDALAGASNWELADNGYTDGTIKVELTDEQLSVAVNFASDATADTPGTLLKASYTGAYASEAARANTFVYDGEKKETKAVFYQMNEDDATVDFYLTSGNIDDAKMLEDCYQYAHITVPYSTLWSGAIDITGNTEFKFDLVDNFNQQTFSLSTGNVGSATGTISVAMQSEDTYTIAIAVDGFGDGHTFLATYDGQCLPYDLSTPNAYALQNGESVTLSSAVITHADGLYTVYLSHKEGVTTVEGMADADIVLVTPEAFVNDGIKGFSGDEERAKVSITYDGVTYSQANTTKGGDSALALGGNVNLSLTDGKVAVDFTLFNIYKYSNANMSGHFEGPATVIE